MPPNARESIELFHLGFLRALVSKGEDKALLALKGGSNLRFFFGSVRYSEDIDFDVVVIGRETLRNKVERLLRSPTLTAPLRAKEIVLTDVSATKQTDTTQRWKIGLRVTGLDLPLRTKVEFSRRDAIEGARFESPEREFLRTHGFPAFLATHYGVHAAIVQKIGALAGRAEPQARDIFDLHLLMTRRDAVGLELSKAQQRVLPIAIEHAMEISFDEYSSKVVSYLDPQQVELYEDRTAWDAMQDAVVSNLEGLR
jgi:predicted nucleotidyltransferase component of viral defense system